MRLDQYYNRDPRRVYMDPSLGDRGAVEMAGRTVIELRHISWENGGTVSYLTDEISLRGLHNAVMEIHRRAQLWLPQDSDDLVAKYDKEDLRKEPRAQP